MDMDEDFLKEIIGELINEANEGLDQLEQDLLALEEDHSDKNVINRIFRTIHTIKGSSGAVGFNKIQNLAHKGETLLDLVRSDVVQVTPELISLQLELMDALIENFVDLEANGVENDNDYSDLEGRLEAAASPEAQSAPPKEQPEEEAPNIENSEDTEIHTEEQEEESAPEASSPIPEQEKPAQPETPKASPAPKGEDKKKSDAPQKSITESFIKVDVKQLDNLMNMV